MNTAEEDEPAYTLWYAIRTKAGAQLPRRVYEAVPSKSKKTDYRLVTSLDPNMSAIEAALTRNRFNFYMPVTRKIVRNRRKTGDFTSVRYPVIHGYVFVHGVKDWPKLAKTPGVAGIVAVDGIPLIIRVEHILTLRSIEADAEESAQRIIDKMKTDAAREDRKAANKAQAAARRRFRPGLLAPVMWGNAVGRSATILRWEADGKIKVIAEGLDGADVISIPYTDLGDVE